MGTMISRWRPSGWADEVHGSAWAEDQSTREYQVEGRS
jgi:hypothetical protein